MEQETPPTRRRLPAHAAFLGTLLWSLYLAAAMAADTPPAPPSGQRPPSSAPASR